VAIVGPHHQPGRPPRLAEPVGEHVDRVGHPGVARVPCHPAAQQRAVVRLGVLQHLGRLHRVEPAVAGRRPPRARGVAALHLDQLGDDLLLVARLDLQPQAMLSDHGDLIEPGVQRPRGVRGCGVGLLEERQQRADRHVHRVQVQAVEPGALIGRPLRVPGREPIGKRRDIGVAPHPGREPLEPGERGRRRLVMALAAHVAVDPDRLRPAPHDRHRGKPVLRDQLAGQRPAQVVELVRAVARLAD
jgi:hypothetical protein